MKLQEPIPTPLFTPFATDSAQCCSLNTACGVVANECISLHVNGKGFVSFVRTENR